jgi:Zn-dependent M28 family amino/carboxypeptidase
MQGSLADVDVRKGSGYIERMFATYYDEESLPYVYKEFSGRSDYQSFAEAGIPAGGLESGAEDVKSVEDRDRFGGVAHAAADTCYHQACDTVHNIDVDGLLSMAQGAATVTMRMAFDHDIMQQLYDTPPTRQRTIRHRYQR